LILFHFASCSSCCFSPHLCSSSSSTSSFLLFFLFSSQHPDPQHDRNVGVRIHPMLML
jgi:hypothetical protein